jgi:hypothetical protein
MILLDPRPLPERADLVAVLAECFAELEEGLSLLELWVSAGEVTVEIAGIDADGRLVLLVCDLVATPTTVTRALEAAVWWQQESDLQRRLFPRVNPEAPPRTIVVGTRFDERALRLVRGLGALAPTAIECRVYDDGEETAVALERLADGAAERARPREAEAPAAAALPAPPTPRAERAVALIHRLDRLGEAFR